MASPCARAGELLNRRGMVEEVKTPGSGRGGGAWDGLFFLSEPDHPDRDRLRQVGEKVRERLASNPAAERIPSNDAELWTFHNFVSAAECDELVTMIDAIARPGTNQFFRSSCYGHLDQCNPVVRRVEERIDDLLGVDGAYGEISQGQRYRIGEQFKPHIDWFQEKCDYWPYASKDGGQRTYTTMVFLNSVEGGGETEFQRLGISIKPEAGMLLVWNNADVDGVPNGYTAHAGNPIVCGVKYILTRWYRCHPFVPRRTGA